MSVTAIVLIVLTAAAFPVLLWAIGRAVTAIGERAPYGLGGRRQYLAGRLDGVRIITVVDGENELLVSLAAQAGDATRGAGVLLAGVFHVTASECSLTRVRRWRNEGTPLRAYLSDDGAIMLADPALGGNAACEPPITVTWHTSKPIITDQSPTEDK